MLDSISISFLRIREYVTASLDRTRAGEEGQGLVEYALILFFVSIVAIAGLTVLGVEVNDLFCTIADSIGDAC